jgi:3-oxoacyl-(acyl-carrier-protein) synthase
MEALKIYAREITSWPCQPFGSERGSSSSVALGEAAGAALLMPGGIEPSADDLLVLGVGWAIERTPSATGISSDGDAFRAAMSMALAEMRLSTSLQVGAVIAHAPGTLKGDAAELSAIRGVFGDDVSVVSTKHLTGHSYGASGMVSLALADALLSGIDWPGFPYPSAVGGAIGKTPPAVAINTAGFGGNAITIIVAKRPSVPVCP